MFGCIIAGRLVQTNLQQVDVNKYVFELVDPATINHIVVFLLGTIPFEAGYAATVHFQWPETQQWQMLGILSNNKSSAVFRLRSGSCSAVNGYAGASMVDTNGTIANGAGSGTSRPAILGISIEPIQSVEAQYAQMQQGKAAVPGSLSSNGSSPTASATTALVAKSSTLPSSLATTQLTPATLQQFLVPVVQKVMTNLYNFVTSFSTDRTSNVSAATQGSQLPFGTAGVSDFSTTATAAGSFGMPAMTASGGGGSGSWATNSGTQGPAIPLKAFEEWYHTFERKVRLDPEFLLRPSNA